MGRRKIKKQLRNLKGDVVELINLERKVEGILEFHPETIRNPVGNLCLPQGYYVKNEGSNEIKVNIKDIDKITEHCITLAFQEPVPYI